MNSSAGIATSLTTSPLSRCCAASASSPSAPGKSSLDFDYLFKIVIVGDSGVGKTALTMRFAEDVFTDSSMPTIGVDFKIRTVDRSGKLCKLQLWDTAGQDRYRNITTNYFRGAVGVCLVFDLTSEKSFENIGTWLADVKRLASQDVSLVLIGTKSDLAHKRAISTGAAQILADSIGASYFETSAKTGEHVNDAVCSLADKIRLRIAELPADAQPARASRSVSLAPRSKDLMSRMCCRG